jgi:aconitate hydratase
MRLYEHGVYLLNGTELIASDEFETGHPAWTGRDKMNAQKGSIAYGFLMAHNRSDDEKHLRLKADVLVSDDPTYVAILQTAKACGLDRFPVPYILSNHVNSLHAIGGTNNSDDHIFGLSAARKFGGIYIPAHAGGMHQYVKETTAEAGKFILGSDSHTRYGALGTLGVGEGGGEVVKQLCGDTYDIDAPEIVAIYLEGKLRCGVGPHDVALALIRTVYSKEFVKNRVMEFVGPGVASLSMDFRNGIDVMTAETACLSSVWITDEKTRRYLQAHGREESYRKLEPAPITWYDRAIHVNLSDIHPMIALPFHPSNAWEIREFQENAETLLKKIEEEAMERCGTRAKQLRLTDKLANGRLQINQAVIGGCAGGLFSNISAVSKILENGDWDFVRIPFIIYPASQPIQVELLRNGTVEKLMQKGVIVKTAFCGACMGNGDIPGNGDVSIRHMPRNFLDREGAQGVENQIALVSLMDSRSIAATLANGGLLTSAEEVPEYQEETEYHFDQEIYRRQIQNYYMAPQPEEPLVYGPNIQDWPEMEPLKDKLLLQICSILMDEVTTTDDLSPSRAAPFRANPQRMASFTLTGRDPEYVGRTEKTEAIRLAVKNHTSGTALPECFADILTIVKEIETIRGNGTAEISPDQLEIGSVIYAKRPGDGSSREQAASGQRVLGGLANIAIEYATKRYRTNMINWGMLPFHMKEEPNFQNGDWIYIPDVYSIVDQNVDTIPAWVIGSENREISLSMLPLTSEEAEIVRKGGLINYNRAKRNKNLNK